MSAIAAAVVGLALGGTLHVRAHAPLGGDGSDERPFATIDAALAREGAGDVIAIEPGLYEEALVIEHPVEIRRVGAVVIAAPSGSAAAIDAIAELRLSGIAIQNGRTGIRVHARADLRQVHFRGQPDAALECAAGAECNLHQVTIESSFAQAVGIRAAGTVKIDGVEIEGPFRRALDVEGELRGSELFVHGAVTGLQASGARVALRDARFEDLRGACVFGARGQMALTEPVFSGCEVAVEVREKEQVQLRGAIIARIQRTALASTDADIVARDLVVEGPSRDGAVMFSGGTLTLAGARFFQPGPAAISARLTRIQLDGVVVEGARMDAQGDFGDGLFAYDSALSGEGLLARGCEGAAIEAQLGEGRLADVEVEQVGQAAVALEHAANLDLDGLLVGAGRGTGLACIERSRARLRAPSFGALAGGHWLVDCGCDLRVQPPDPALTACKPPGKPGENPP